MSASVVSIMSKVAGVSLSRSLAAMRGVVNKSTSSWARVASSAAMRSAASLSSMRSSSSSSSSSALLSPMRMPSRAFSVITVESTPHANVIDAASSTTSMAKRTRRSSRAVKAARDVELRKRARARELKALRRARAVAKVKSMRAKRLARVKAHRERIKAMLAAAKEKERLRRLAAKRDPLMPKRPSTPYLMYCEEVRPAMLAKGMSIIEAARESGQMWRALTPEARNAYHTRAAQARATYRERLAEYVSKHPKPPTRPPTAFLLFCAERRAEAKRAAGGSLSLTVVEQAKRWSLEWRTAATDMRQRFADEYKRRCVQYELDLKAWQNVHGGGANTSAAASATVSMEAPQESA